MTPASWACKNTKKSADTLCFKIIFMDDAGKEVRTAYNAERRMFYNKAIVKVALMVSSNRLSALSVAI